MISWQRKAALSTEASPILLKAFAHQDICYYKNMNSLKYLALAGDTVYILWVLYNGIDEGFRDIGSIQGIVSIGLMLLLVLNIFLLRDSK